MLHNQNLVHRISNYSSKLKSREFTTLVATFFLLVCGTYLFFIFHKDYTFYERHYLNPDVLRIISKLSVILLTFKTVLFLYIGYNYLKYKPITAVADHLLPNCTIIVPAYNEGRQVYDTLVSISKSDYPKDKLELISIDDGSQDDTWSWIKRARKDLDLALHIHQQPQNMGKRQALYHGFKNGTGEVFITIDSDSVVEQNTLRELVSPFTVNKNCGAVAGNIKVLNTDKGILPKMLDVSFVMSFEFARSAESSLNSVFCTPGALAAYRKSSVTGCLDTWINQTFMGNPSDIGEDRALTNMILKQGQDVVFQKNAIAYTKVPETYQGLYKMFIRWGRSNVRETIAMSEYVFTRYRSEGMVGPRVLLISQLLNMILCYPLLLLMLFFVLTHPLLFLSGSLLSMLIISSFSWVFYAKGYKTSEGLWAYTYSLLFTFGLFWITPYAIATARKSGWITRGLSG